MTDEFHEWAPMPLTADDPPDHACGGRCACVHCSRDWSHPIHTNYSRAEVARYRKAAKAAKEAVDARS